MAQQMRDRCHCHVKSPAPVGFQDNRSPNYALCFCTIGDVVPRKKLPKRTNFSSMLVFAVFILQLLIVSPADAAVVAGALETKADKIQMVRFGATPRKLQGPTSAPVTKSPTSAPVTKSPTSAPVTKSPTMSPSKNPTASPTKTPTKNPTDSPSKSPTKAPTVSPSKNPTKNPTKSPTKAPTSNPTKNPTKAPTSKPSVRPSVGPTKSPTSVPSANPSDQPSRSPSERPTSSPSSDPSGKPSSSPSSNPSSTPTSKPSGMPSQSPSSHPSRNPSQSPSSSPSRSPTTSPSKRPTSMPTDSPSQIPSGTPTLLPTLSPSNSPSSEPTKWPSSSPSGIPSTLPSERPSRLPSEQPTVTESLQPSAEPTVEPSSLPSRVPSSNPSASPSASPSMDPSSSPSSYPSSLPSRVPSSNPSASPSASPSMDPSSSPSSYPSAQPFASPSSAPSSEPSSLPTVSPSSRPSSSPTLAPTSLPSQSPSDQPSSNPTSLPSSLPTVRPSNSPSSAPSLSPTQDPSAQPSNLPSLTPTRSPSTSPSVFPTSEPTQVPTQVPSVSPTAQPSLSPSESPSVSARPSQKPSNIPSVSPSLMPSSKPSYSEQTLSVFVKFQFDNLDEFDGNLPRSVLETETSRVVSASLQAAYPDSFTVIAELDSQRVIQSESRRNLKQAKTASFPRGLQTTISGLQVSIEVFLRVRSATTYSIQEIQETIGRAFDTTEEREDFIEALQQADSTFSRINNLAVEVDNTTIELIEENSSAWIYIGIGIGAAVTAISGYLFFGVRRRRRQREIDDNDVIESRDDEPQGPGGFIETGGDNDNQDISTLGDPVGGGPTAGLFAPHFAQEDPNNESTLSAGWDFKMAYGGAGDLPSVSSAGGTRSAEGDRALADDLTQDENIRRVDSVDASRVTGAQEDLSLFEDDASFDRVYGEDERIDVYAPRGKLGVVIDTPMNGPPMVHAIKETSVLADMVRIGDKLVSVDGEDTTQMSAIRVSKLISSKAMEEKRHMVFMRSTPMG